MESEAARSGSRRREGDREIREEAAGSAAAHGEERYGPVRVLRGERGGRYPQGNSLLVAGEREVAIVDPSLGLLTRADSLPRVDRVLHSHCHEDHIAGSHLFPDIPWYFHAADLVGITSLDAMMAIYGLDAPTEAAFRTLIVDEFHYTSREDAQPFGDGDAFDLGGVVIRVIHTPGHTRGHCCFLVSWEEGDGAPRRLLFLGDIDLSSFGPYYGDAWSSLSDFAESIARVREIEADWYATFHHIGVIADREVFLERLERFESVIASREQRLLEYLAEPHHLDDVVEHRFIYRKTDSVSYANAVERRSMAQHIERLLARGQLQALDDGRYVVR